jgi:hypothetical protein
MRLGISASMTLGLNDIARRIWALLPLVGVLFLLPRLVLWVQIGTTFVAWPWQFDSAEGVNLNATVELAQGHNIYAPNGPDYFISAPYTPLFYLLNVPFTWLTGPSLGVGRAISMLATLAIAVLLFYVVRKMTSVWSAGVLAGALWLSISPVITWSALYTQHTLSLALGFGGLAWTLQYVGVEGQSQAGRHERLLYIGAVLFALAFYAKQSAIDAAAATTLWLIVLDVRRGLRFALALAALIAIPFVLVNLIVQGGLWEKVVANHAGAWSSGRALRLTTRLWAEYWPLIVWGAVCLTGIIVGFINSLLSPGRRELRSALASPWALAAFYLVASALSVIARIGYDGINYNHFLDVLIPFCILAGLSAGWVLNWLQTHVWAPIARATQENVVATPKARQGVALGGLALCTLLLVAQLLQYKDPHTWYIGMWPEPARDAQMRALSKLVAETPGDILSDDSYLLLSNKRKVLYDDSFMFATLADSGRWDNSVLVRSLRDRRFPLLFLFDTDRWPENQQQALHDDYTLKFLDALATYVPILVPASPQYDLQCTLSKEKDSVSLEGYSLAPGITDNGVGRGEVLRAALYWRAGGKLQQNYASYVHMVNDKGENLASQDNPHTGASSPTTSWSTASTITDTASIPIPGNLAPGRYRLVAGMYRFDQASGKIDPLPASCAQGEQYGDAVSLGWVAIK